MTVNENYTPLPDLANTPMRVEVGDWFDLDADSRERLLRHNLFRDQIIDLQYAGASPASEVSLELVATAQTSRGEITTEEEYQTEALASFSDPVDVGPVATTQLDWQVRNRSNLAHEQAGNNPYQAFINYEVRPMTVLDKLRRDISLSQSERQLSRDFNLGKYTRMNVTPPKAPYYRADLDGKTLRETSAVVDTVNISGTGAGNAETIFDYNVRPDEVLYITGLSVNGQSFSYDDNLILQFTRDGTDSFYRLETYGIPGGDYKANLHIPILTDLNVSAFASTAINNIEVTLEYARVHRTLLEKALYDLEGEVATNDSLAAERSAVFEELQQLMEVGLPVVDNIDTVLSETGADDKVLEAQ